MVIGSLFSEQQIRTTQTIAAKLEHPLARNHVITFFIGLFKQHNHQFDAQRYREGVTALRIADNKEPDRRAPR